MMASPNNMADYENHMNAKADGWLNISSAPTDGTRIDLWCAYGREPDCVFSNGVWVQPEWDSEQGFYDCVVIKDQNPSHWMMPPNAPIRIGVADDQLLVAR